MEMTQVASTPWMKFAEELIAREERKLAYRSGDSEGVHRRINVVRANQIIDSPLARGLHLSLHRCVLELRRRKLALN